MAERKKDAKASVKTTAKSPAVQKTSAEKKDGAKKDGTKKTAERPRAAAKKETTRVTAQPARFGDSILDEVILLLIILISVVIFVSLLTDKMGVIGNIISAFFKGILGFGGILAPIFVVTYCIWMLVSKEKKYPLVRILGALLFLLTAASAASLINPIETAEGLSFTKRCGELFRTGAFSNGGLFGGLIGSGLYSVLDTLGSSIVLIAALIISIVMATGRSFFYAIADMMSHRKARKKAKNQKIKQRAEQIRQQELLEEERLAKKEERRRKKAKMREDFNIELHEDKKKTDAPYVEETVFRKKPMVLETKKREPIYNYVKETEESLDIPEKDAMKAAAAVMAASALEAAAKPKEMAASALEAAAKPKEMAASVLEAAAKPKEMTAVSEIEEEPAFVPALEEPVRIAEQETAEGIAIEMPESEQDAIPIIDISFEEEAEMISVADEFQEKATAAPVPERMAEEAEKETEKESVKIEKVEAVLQEETQKEIPMEPVEEEKPYIFPPIELLGADPQMGTGNNRAEMVENARKLETTLKSFGVDAKVIQISKGPTVTRYEVSPSQGVKVSKIVNLADDIALNLAASGIRIEAPIPGKAAVGIEVPNKETQSVYMRTILESDAFREHTSKVAFALGQDITGNPVVTDIAKMPHLLIAGATGSGKSVCINTLITSILYKADPKEVKLLLVDPKVVELSVYNGIPHLLIPVVTDPKKASAALNWAVREMLQRYNDFAAHGVRDIKGFNKMMEEKGDEKGKMPQIVIIIDELADLMMAAPGEVEDAICRLAQMARAAGMHLIIATQRPSVDVITGVIKANIPSRLAFAVSSGIDSRTILDVVGAEKLLGKGDMLFYPQGQSKPSRLQGAFVTDQEVEAIVGFLKQSSKPYYTAETIDRITSTGKADGGEDGEADEFYGQAVDLVIEKEKASVSMLQRQFRIGYNRAARLMDELERRGIVGPEEGSKPRKVLITKSEWEERTGAVPEEI